MADGIDRSKVEQFIELAGQIPASRLVQSDPSKRELGAQLLLSEVLEYVISGLGVTPEFNGVKITDPNGLKYTANLHPNLVEMVDGLADTAYTMFWNAIMFGVPLEEAFDLVCDNNLEKFVRLEDSSISAGTLPREKWNCGLDIKWPAEVTEVSIVRTGGSVFAVGKDKNGKVRKPSSYSPLSLEDFVDRAANCG